jgi:hypothetical protein
LNFKPCEADPDVWMRMATKENGFEYYEYALCYVDDIMFISGKVDKVIKELAQHFELKTASGGQNKTNRTIQYQFNTVTICFFIFSQLYCMLQNKNTADQKLEFTVHEFYRLRSCRMHVLSKNSPMN